MWPFRPKPYIILSDLFADLKAILGEMRAHDIVYLVSPYIKLEANVKRAIKEAREQDVKIHLLVRKGEATKSIEDSRFLAEVGVQVKEMENLHAKVYWCRKVAITTSMNLHEHSDRNNVEISVYFEGKRYVREIKEIVDKWWGSASTVAVSELVGVRIGVVQKDKLHAAHCIACRTQIPYAKDKPMCPKCFGSWKESGQDRQRKEKYCLSCGQSIETTINDPLCSKCK